MEIGCVILDMSFPVAKSHVSDRSPGSKLSRHESAELLRCRPPQRAGPYFYGARTLFQRPDMALAELAFQARLFARRAMLLLRLQVGNRAAPSQRTS